MARKKAAAKKKVKAPRPSVGQRIEAALREFIESGKLAELIAASSKNKPAAPAKETPPKPAVFEGTRTFCDKELIDQVVDDFAQFVVRDNLSDGDNQRLAAAAGNSFPPYDMEYEHYVEALTYWCELLCNMPGANRDGHDFHFSYFVKDQGVCLCLVDKGGNKPVSATVSEHSNNMTVTWKFAEGQVPERFALLVKNVTKNAPEDEECEDDDEG